jgi:DNA-binding MarR family transcriptional regulator
MGPTSFLIKVLLPDSYVYVTLAAMRDGHELAMALRAAYLAMHRQTDALLAPSGVTADQFVILWSLSERDALSQRELVERTSSDPNTLRAMLVLLEQRGLIERPPHPTDGRARSVALTATGRRLYRKLWRVTEPLRRQLLVSQLRIPAGPLAEQLQRLIEMFSPESPSLSSRLIRGSP